MEIIQISPLDDQGRAKVAPNGSYTVHITLTNSRIAWSDDIKIHFVDLDSVAKQIKTLIVSILTEDPRNIR